MQFCKVVWVNLSGKHISQENIAPTRCFATCSDKRLQTIQTEMQSGKSERKIFWIRGALILSSRMLGDFPDRWRNK